MGLWEPTGGFLVMGVSWSTREVGVNGSLVLDLVLLGKQGIVHSVVAFNKGMVGHDSIGDGAV